MFSAPRFSPHKMRGYVSADLCFIVWLDNTIAHIVAHIWYPLFACVSNLIIITEPHLAFRWVLRLFDYWLHHGSMALIFPPLAPKDFLLRVVECPWLQDFIFGRNWKRNFWPTMAKRMQ